MNPGQKATRRRGVSTVLAMMLLTMFASLGVAMVTANNRQVVQAENHARVQAARLQAESGLSFFLRTLSNISVSGATEGQDLLDTLAAILGERLNGSANLGGATVSYDETTITIPAIATDDLGGSFSARITLVEDSTVRLRVVGTDGTITRPVSMNLTTSPFRSSIFNFAIASKSRIEMNGNARILGANSSSEANMLTTTYTDLEALDLTGNCRIEGDVSISNPAAHASLTGNVSVGGESGSSGAILDHIHIGVGDVPFPEVDPTVFEIFAVNIVDSGTKTNGNKTFSNIRILANTNKTFGGNITLNGVTYIEYPNIITFSGNLTVTGVIVTEDAGDDAYDINRLKFTGNTTVLGVEDLPDTPEYADLREMPGSFLLAPGFGVDFTGNFGTFNGTIAADEFYFRGNASGTVFGSVINYSDSTFRLTGNSNLTFDRSSDPETPLGFFTPSRLSPVAGSYTEY